MTRSYLQPICRRAPFLLSRSAKRHFSCSSCIVCTQILAATALCARESSQLLCIVCTQILAAPSLCAHKSLQLLHCVHVNPYSSSALCAHKSLQHLHCVHTNPCSSYIVCTQILPALCAHANPCNNSANLQLPGSLAKPATRKTPTLPLLRLTHLPFGLCSFIVTPLSLLYTVQEYLHSSTFLLVKHGRYICKPVLTICY